MEHHLCKSGFMPNYERWYEHGESQEDGRFSMLNDVIDTSGTLSEARSSQSSQSLVARKGKVDCRRR
jgi:hypothetical protein